MELVKHHSPFQLQNEINRLFGSWGAGESSLATANWVPPADIAEYADRFELYVDLPGVDTDRVEINLDKGVLSISGERNYPDATDSDAQRPHRIERGQGKFHRRFILPDTVDTDSVEATSHLGVLQISIGKQAKAQPKRIAVTSAVSSG
jgi:HSP20 family protein